MRPDGIKRTFNPKKWEHGTQVLVFGEFVAFGVAVLALIFPANSQLFVNLAAVIGAGALFWYALGKSSLGEMPLTGVSARRIAQVARMVNAEEKLGPVVQWDTVSADGAHADVDFSKMTPAAKIGVARQMFEKLAPAESHFVLQRKWTEADADAVLEVLMPRPFSIRFSGGEPEGSSS